MYLFFCKQKTAYEMRISDWVSDVCSSDLMARAIAPVDEGNLRESIDVSTRLARSQAGDKGALAPVEMYVGPGQHPQAITQEFGTFKEAAQPFMRPAWDAQRVHALDIIGTALGIELDKAAKRYAKKVAAGKA